MTKTTSVSCLIALSFLLPQVTSLATAQVKTAKSGSSNAPRAELNPYLGAPVTLVKASNGEIANKKILDGIEKVAWLKPTIERPAEGIWVFGGYGFAPISIIDTDERLIAFDTGDSKHDGELLLGRAMPNWLQFSYRVN